MEAPQLLSALAKLVAALWLVLGVVWLLRASKSLKMGSSDRGERPQDFGKSDRQAHSNEMCVSAFLPDRLPRTSWFTIQIWAHTVADAGNVNARAAEAGNPLKAGGLSGLAFENHAVVTLRLSPKKLLTGQSWKDRRKSVTKSSGWNGFPRHFDFPVRRPLLLFRHDIYEIVEVLVNGIPVGECLVLLRFDRRQPSGIAADFRRFSSGFASYSTEDRPEVIGRLQMLQSAIGWSPFFDVESIRAGEDWEKRIMAEVPTKDVFLLFWSRNAANSAWVDREWRLALQKRGLDYIKPIPLELTDPPFELRSLQFADKWSRMLDYERIRKGAA